ncbi:MAG: fumarylacetoacetate hydrolase, partial [Alphaproteobacteria bacterium]|nr:fumarylacetoacetate hydrolase [Alphaproteobacteria bacterium]
MKLVTLANGTPDGRLHVASRDGRRAVPAENAETLQQALETWAENASVWQAQYDRLNAGEAADVQPLSADAILAPLPRAWQWLDG